MSRSTLCLILTFLIFSLGEGSRASNEFVKPTIYPPPSLKVDKCQLVRVLSFASGQEQVFGQVGVGWVIQGQEGYRVLTPAHVVSGAQSIAIECKGVFYRAAIQSKTETRDLALLKLESDSDQVLFPLIELKTSPSNPTKSVNHFEHNFNKLLSYQISNLYLIPGDRSKEELEMYRSYERDLNKIGLAHTQNSINSLVAPTLAIRPGFSGAPLFIEVQVGSFNGQYIPTVSFLAGMLTKVEINGSRSLGINLPEILEVLSILWTSSDPNTDTYVKERQQKVSLRYQNRIVGSAMYRDQELIFNRDGKRLIYSESCDESQLESSEWKTVDKSAKKMIEKINQRSPVLKIQSLKDLERIKREILKENIRPMKQKGGGGDYGEGGGSLVSLDHASLMTTAPKSWLDLTLGNLTSYKKSSSCKVSFLHSSEGQKIDHVLIGGKITKTTNLSELYDALTASNARVDKCSSFSLSGGEVLTTPYKNKSDLLYYYRSEGKALHNAQDTLLNSEEFFRGSMKCDPSNGSLEVYYKSLSYRIQLSLGPKKSGSLGTIEFQGDDQCRLEVKAHHYKVANRWKHQIRSSNIDLDIVVGDLGRVLSFKFLKVPDQCRISFESLPRGKFWLSEDNFSLSEDVNEQN